MPRGPAGGAAAPPAAPEWEHRVEGLEAGLPRLLDRAAIDDTRRVPLDRAELLRRDRALAVHGLAERVHHAAHQRLAAGDLGDAVGALDGVAFLDGAVLAEEDGPDVVLLEVEDHADNVPGELQQLAGHRLLEPVDACDAVPGLDDAADLLQADL